MKIIVIGAGPGGYETAVEARKRGLDVTLITAGPLGGTCLNEGCIPTKCFCHDAQRIAAGLAASSETDCPHKSAQETSCGVEGRSAVPADALRKMVERKDRVVEQLRSGVEKLLKGVEIVRGIARVADAETVRVWPTEAESAAAEHLDPEYSEYREFKADRIIIATGSHPAWLDVPGAVETPGVLSSSDMLRLTEIPERLTVIGGGVIGLEFASVFSALGSKVTVIEYCKGLLPHFDSDLAKRLRQSLVKSGITILTGTQVTGIAAAEETSSDAVVSGVQPVAWQDCGATGLHTGDAAAKPVQCEKEYAAAKPVQCEKEYAAAKPVQIVFYRAAGESGEKSAGETAEKIGSVVSDKVLMAVGRVPDLRVITGCRGIESGRKGIKVDGNMQTTLPGVYAIGDANGRMMLAHAAVAQGKVALNHILCTADCRHGEEIHLENECQHREEIHLENECQHGEEIRIENDFKRTAGIRLDIMPAAVFTTPEVATVGLTEEDCKARGIAYKALKSFYRANGKALASETPEGYCKILVAEPQPDRRAVNSGQQSPAENGRATPLKPGQILGCHILGEDASNLISEITALMNFNATVLDLGNIIHPHPTLSEIIHSCAETI